MSKYVITLQNKAGMWNYNIDSTVNQAPGYDEDELTYDGAGGCATKDTLVGALKSMVGMIKHIEDLSKRVDDNQGITTIKAENRQAGPNLEANNG